ncbi:MAG: DUF4142 domain-containing protein [Verrucomicrobiota bacterium]
MNAPLLASILTAATLSLGFSLESRGADDARNAGAVSGRLGVPEETFVLKAAQDELMQIQLGELAQQKGRRAGVTKFADSMVTDHTRLNDALKALASQKGITLPDRLDAIHAGVVDRLSKLEGEQFDKAYIDEMIRTHRTSISGFEEAAKISRDTDLRTFLSRGLPALKTHLKQIQNIQFGAG